MVRAEGRPEVLITTSVAYLIGSCSNFDTKGIALCDNTGEDVATLSIKYLKLVKILEIGLKLFVKSILISRQSHYQKTFPDVSSWDNFQFTIRQCAALLKSTCSAKKCKSSNLFARIGRLFKICDRDNLYIMQVIAVSGTLCQIVCLELS